MTSIGRSFIPHQPLEHFRRKPVRFVYPSGHVLPTGVQFPRNQPENNLLDKGMAKTRLIRRTKRRTGRRKIKRTKRIPQLWPRQQLVRMKATHKGVLTGTSGAIGTEAFYVNSLVDPFGSAGAELPLGLDQWAALYSKYCIVGAKLTVLAHASVATGSVCYGVSLMPTSATLTSIEHYREKPFTAMKMLSSDVDHSGLKNGIQRQTL